MFKAMVIIVVIIIGMVISGPIVLREFAKWDASNPDDDKSDAHLLLRSMTPDVPPAILRQSMDIDGAARIIDVRSKEEYEEGFIQGALNIPEETLYTEIPKMFPDKKTLIYMYCDTGHRGAVSTRLLRAMGYERAFNMEDGLKGWQKLGLPIVTQNPQYF